MIQPSGAITYISSYAQTPQSERESSSTKRYAWCYHQPQRWHLRLKGDNADRKFSEVANEIKGKLPELRGALQKVTKLEHILATSPMIDWHAAGKSEKGPQPVVDPALAIMLNLSAAVW